MSWKIRRAEELIRATFAELKNQIVKSPDISSKHKKTLIKLINIRKEKELRRLYEGSSFFNGSYRKWKDLLTNCSNSTKQQTNNCSP